VLTVELLKVRCRAGQLQPLWLKGKAADAWQPTAEVLIELFQQAEGMTVGQLQELIASTVGDAADKVRAAGLAKLLWDRCELQECDSAEAEQTRRLVFGRAAELRRGLGLLEVFDRAAVVQACAQGAGRTAEQLDDALFADLPGAQLIRGFERTSAIALLQRYNLALAQGVLLRATRVYIELEPCAAARIRELFRALKFRRLMHQVSGTAADGYRIVVDGPMSLFESTQRYGLQLAMLLPTLVAGEGWKLRADVLWGKERRAVSFSLSDGDGLVSGRTAADEPEELQALVRTFSRLESEWVVRQEATIFDLKGKGVFVPDLVFEHPATGRRVFLEVFGYWSRQAVFQRLELLQADFPARVVLAVSRKLRVSEQAADDSFPGRILVYSQSISAHAVRQLLQQL
jgi:hypothetical protein